MQPVADYDLETLLKSLGCARTNAECLRPFFGCLAGAIQYLHENKIRHRDLKSRNILVKDGQVFVADFGTAYSWKGSRHSITNHRNVPFTAEYIAPEIALHQIRSTASDMWSLGVVFLEMSTVLLGSTVRKLKSLLRNFSHPRGTEPYLWANLPAIDTWIEELARCAAVRDESTEPLSWVRDLLQERPNKRPKAGDLMQQILESPSFHAFCCVDCLPQYEQRSFLYTLQSQDNNASAPGNSADVQAQLTALLDPPVNKAREQEKNQTIEYWLNTVADDDINLTSVGVSGTAESSNIEVPIRIVEDDSTYYSAESSDEERMVQFDELSITSSYQSLNDTTQPHSGQADDELERTTIPLEGSTESIESLAAQGEEAHKPDAEIGAAYVDCFQSRSIWLSAEVEHNVWAEDDRTDTATQEPEFPANMLPSSNTVWGCDESQDLAPPLPLTERSISNPYYQEQREFASSRFIPGEKVSSTFNLDEEPAVSLSLEQKMTRTSCEDKVLTVQSTELAKPHPLTSTGTQGKSETASVTTRRDYGATVVWSRETEPCGEQPAYGSTDDAPNGQVQTTDSNRSSLSQKSDANIEKVQGNASQRAPKSELVLLQSPRFEKKRSNNPPREELHISPPPEKKNQTKEQVDENASIGKLQGDTTAFRSETEDQASSTKEQSAKVRFKKDSMSLHKQALLSSAKQTTTKRDSLISVFSPEVYMNTAWEAASTQDTRIVPINRRKLWWKWIDRDQHILEGFCTEGAVQAVRTLLRDGCNPGTKSKPRPAPLLRAIQGGTYQHYKCVQALMNHDVDLNVADRQTGRTALQIAIEQPFFNGHTSLVRDLIHGGADTNKADHTGKRPVMSVFDVQENDALRKHQLDALACLLVGGQGKETDVNVHTPHAHESPLHLAIRRRSPMAVGLLLFRGASVNAKNHAGATPLLLAAAQWAGPLVADQKTILDLLLQKPDINLNEIAGVHRRTALHQAVVRASTTAVEMLLERGADISIKDSEDKTGRQLASMLDTAKWKDEKAEIIRLLYGKEKKAKT